MPRASGPARGLKHSIHTLLTDAEYEQLQACMDALNLTQSEVIRQAVTLFHFTKCLSNPPAQTIHTTGQGKAA